MDHIAIMNKSWKLIPKIVSGEKTIESRWYQTRRSPWDIITKGDRVYFKNAGDLVTAVANVVRVLQFHIHSEGDVRNIVKKYGKNICLVNDNPTTWGKLPKYCILVFLKNAKVLSVPFQINKAGFGIGAAWLSADSIEKLRMENKVSGTI